MDDSSGYQTNPWSHDDHSLGLLRNILAVAEKTGHRRVVDEGHDIDTDSSASEQQEPTSMKMLHLLKDISKKRRKIEQANLDIQRRLLDKETTDITHTDIIEKRVERLNELNTHIQKVVGHKDQLISCLQQPYVGDYLKVDATFKKYVSELFPQIVPILSELSSQLDTIHWASEVDISDGQLDSVLGDVTMTLANLQSNFKTLTSLSDTVHNLPRKHESTMQ